MPIKVLWEVLILHLVHLQRVVVPVGTMIFTTGTDVQTVVSAQVRVDTIKHTMFGGPKILQ